VRGIAPMVFDNLNFQEQMERQLGLWGRFSEQIEDYTRRGLQQQMETARGRKLLSLVDPWSYRERLTMPKLLIHGANDRYWATDATRAYWNGLPGDKYLLSVPNAGHGLEDRQRVVNTLVAFFGAVADGRRLPRLREEQRVRRGEIVCRVRADVAPREARLWTVRAPDLDFRPAKWESTPLGAQGGELVGRTRRPEGEGLALFTEAEFEREGEKFTLSTPPTVYGRRAARNGQPGKAEVRP